MRILIPGTDRGNAVLLVLVLNLILSITLIALVQRINAVRDFTFKYKGMVMDKIEKENKEVLNNYDLN